MSLRFSCSCDGNGVGTSRGSSTPSTPKRPPRGPLLVLLAAALVVAGCSGSDPAGQSATSEPDREQREATTAPPPAPPPPAPLSLPGWRSAYRLWLDQVRGDLREVGLTVSDPRTLKALRRRGLDEYRDGAIATRLESLESCARLEEMLTPPPKRVQQSVRVLRRACGPLERGAAHLRTAVEDGKKGSLRRAVGAWRSAANLVEAANVRLRAPERAEALPLPVEDGLTPISRIEPLFTRVTRLMGEGEYVARCWSEPDWRRIEREEFGKQVDLAGFANEGFGNLNLAPEICDSLARLAYGGERPTGIDQLDAAFAVVVLMHETAHLGEGYEYFTREEAEAECWGMQFVRPAARALGVDAAYAAELADRYWNDVYPLVEAKYRSADCRNGGKLDARPRSDVWP